MSTAPRAREVARGGLYIAITVIALLVTVYLALQALGFLVRLFLLAAAAVIALAAWRAWRRAA